MNIRFSQILRCGILTLVLLLVCGSAKAQMQTNGSNSPYSRYGFGLLSDRGQGFNKGMAGLSYGMRSGTQLNVKNPASYSAIDSLSFLFDIGFSLQNGNLEQNGEKVNAHNSSFDYISMGFRAAKNVGVSFGLMPFSTIGYNMSRTSEMANNNNIVQTNSFSGSGGLHEVYLGAGWRPFKFASVGFNVGYLWGDMTNTTLTSFSETNIASRRNQYVADIRTYKAEFGLQLMKNFGRKNSLTLGLTYGLGHDINSRSEYYNQTISGTTTNGDTLTARNAFALPHTFGAGLTWNYKNSLRVGVDYNFQKWADVKSPVLTTAGNGDMSYDAQVGRYTDMHKVTLGAEYVNDPFSLRWRDHIRYRVGFSYTSPYTRIGSQDGPSSYLVSLGVGLPIMNMYNNRSLLNISAQYEHIKPKFAGMITERYLRLTVGLSFNESWFKKWKVE